MTRSARQVATQVSFEPPPPYTEVSSDVPLSRSAPSTVSSPPTGIAPLPSAFLKAASSRISTRLQRCAPPCERGGSLEDSATPSSTAETSRDASDVPSGAQLVQAPYQLKRKNSSIFCDFLLFGGDPADTSVPDMRLQTKNALLQSAIYINAQKWDRPVSIDARTKNSDLRLGIHTLQADQAVRVRASTKNGRSTIFLPRDFKGVLAVSTKNGKCTLSADLKKVAVRIPGRYEETLKDDETFGRRESSDRKDSDVPNQLSNGVDVWYEINGDGPSAAIVDTKNGNVWAGFVGDDEVGCWPCCSVI